MKKPHKDYFIFEIEKLECHLAHVHILEGNEYRATINEAMRSHQKYGNIRLRTYYFETYSESSSIQIKPQRWLGERQLSM